MTEQQLIKSSREDQYRVTFTLTEDIPDIDQDIGNHEYAIIMGARYRIDFQGDFSLPCARRYRRVLLETAREEILQDTEEKPTAWVKVSLQRGWNDRFLEYLERKIQYCEKEIQKTKLKGGE